MDPAVAAAVISGSLGIAASALAVTIGMVRPRKAIRAVHEQVANTHTTNLREDIDRLIVGQERLIESVAEIRTDVAWERRERSDLDHRVRILEGVS